MPATYGDPVVVASREGGVDRNASITRIAARDQCRLPRGGRGSQLTQGGAMFEVRESPPARGAWIATLPSLEGPLCSSSPPARGAWIATRCAPKPQRWHPVASREGGVDRNMLADRVDTLGGVASREGGVDRNMLADRVDTLGGVASREGGVDRNHLLRRLPRHPGSCIQV